MWNYLDALSFLLERDITKRIVLYSETRGCVCYGIGYVSRDRYGVAIRIGKYYTSGIVNSPLKLGRNLQIKESLIVWSSLCRYYIWKTHWGTMNCHFYKYIFCWVCLLCTSTSRLLVLSVLRLRRLNMKGDIILPLIHISGKEWFTPELMVNLEERLMKGGVQGNSMIFLPIHQPVLERSNSLLQLVHYWWLKKEALTLMTPNYWYAKMFS